MGMAPEKNALLTRVGPGTPMGDLLRRYWHPVAAVTELAEDPVKPVRVFGEDFVLFRDEEGNYGLLDRHCPHRRADLSYGYVDECGLRCSYHGWSFAVDGRCTEQPFEETVTGRTRFRDMVTQPSYPVAAQAGLLFVYLGPDPAPLLPNWELFDYEDGFRQIVLATVDCNWLQCAENDLDPVHFEWLHDNWSYAQSGRRMRRSPRHLRIRIDDWDYGFGYRRIREGTDEESPVWTQMRFHLMPNVFMPGGNHFEYRVPIDDEHTLSVVWAYEAVPAESRPYVQDEIPHWYATMVGEDGRMLTTHVINQDTVAWAGQGAVTDRENEHLGNSDAGVIRLRHQLLDDLDAVARGEDPMGVIRDPEKNVRISWPDDRRADITAAVPRSQWWEAKVRAAKLNGLRAEDDYFIFYAGQPPHVRAAYEAAMGISAGQPASRAP